MHPTKPYAPVGMDIESAYSYRDGGFHPVNIGDNINSRYRVLKKLGFGTNGTVWLVEDFRLNRFASLKVMTARASSMSSELSISRHLQTQREQNVNHPGCEHVIQIFDTFIIEGPNGTHHCVVTEVLGISLASRVEPFYGYGRHIFPMDVIKKVVAQVSLAVAFLHKCGVIHGDLHLANVLFYSSKLQAASREDLDRIYGSPKLRPVFYIDYTPVPPSPHLPQNLIGYDDTVPLLELCLSSIDDIHVKICDFGEAAMISASNHSIEMPLVSCVSLVYTAPEIIFKDIPRLTTSTDVWALGVLLYMILNVKYPPFNMDCGSAAEVIEQMVMALGKPPNKWCLKLTKGSETFSVYGSYLLELTKKPASHELMSVTVQGSTEQERESFRHLFNKIFRYEPGERVDAEEVVRLLPQGWVDPQTLETELGGVISSQGS